MGLLHLKSTNYPHPNLAWSYILPLKQLAAKLQSFKKDYKLFSKKEQG